MAEDSVEHDIPEAQFLNVYADVMHAAHTELIRARADCLTELCKLLPLLQQQQKQAEGSASGHILDYQI